MSCLHCYNNTPTMKQSNKELLKFLSLMPLCAIATYCLTCLNYSIWLPLGYAIIYTILSLVGGYVAWKTWRGRSFWRLGISLLLYSALVHMLIKILMDLIYNIPISETLEVNIHDIAFWIFCSIIPTAVCCMIYKYIYSR